MDEATMRPMYRTLGYDKGGKGWTFAMTPVARMTTADTVIVGLNPGGDSGGELWEFPIGNAYFDERWGPNDTFKPIQSQVQALHQLLGLSKDDVFAAQFIPFRSPGIAGLDNLKQAIAFGREIWKDVIRASPARRYICMGQLAGSNLVGLLEASLTQQHCAGHGVTTVDRHVAKDGRVVVVLPHLSRFQILSPKKLPETLTRTQTGILAAAKLG